MKFTDPNHNPMGERVKLTLILTVFAAAYLVPLEQPAVRGAVLEALMVLQEYARKHVLFCLVPAFFIAGAVSVFVSKAAVMRYLGAGAPRTLAYSVASVSGAILAVCSCTVLPLFAGIYKRGAGIGPATAFLYSGPAINVLAAILTARVLGWQIGLARAVGAVAFALVIGLLMAILFRKEEGSRQQADLGSMLEGGETGRPLWKNGLYFLAMVLILVFAAWGRPAQPTGLWNRVYTVHWYAVGVLLVGLGAMLWRWFRRDELTEWVSSTWGFSKQILPLLLGGVLVAGFLMGRPETNAGLIPAGWISGLVGGNSLTANLLASLAGALMYFATLTEVPIVQGLMGAGMGKGPALALLLAGPALSLPSMLVIRSVIGTKKTLTYIGLVAAMATLTGYVFGAVS